MAKRGRKKGSRKEPFKLRLKKTTVYSISSTVLFVIGGLVLLSFAKKGSLLLIVHSTLVKFFGWSTVFLPFLFISAGLMLTRLKWRITKPNLLVGGCLIFVSALGLSRAGIAGLQVWQGLKVLITAFGAAIMLLGSLVIGFVVLFETSLEEVFLSLTNFFKMFRKVKKTTLHLIKTEEKQLSSPPAGQMEIKGLGEEGKEEKKIVKKEPQAKDEKEEEPVIQTISSQKSQLWQPPPLSILVDSIGGKADRGDLEKNAAVIEKTLESFGVEARVAEVNRGPAVTQYALEIVMGTKLSKITALSNDLALALAAPTGQIRIEAPIPGRSLVGVEVPNKSLEMVTLKKILISDKMEKIDSKLAVGLGLDVSGQPVVDNIARMPHVLVAGATGAGKSVCINNIIATILFRAAPDEVKLILVDPKRVELTQYNGIPHLLAPVIVEPEKVVSALKWAIVEMETRYKKFAQMGARNIKSYNKMVDEEKMPYILIIIDELADIMFYSPAEVEDAITRIAQMARATGIHLIVSTQRPSVEVITGLIKANIPCRIAFNVSSMIDSRVIIDMPGAEKLLGQGDMLYIPPDQAKPTRIQGAYISEEEIRKLIKFIKQTNLSPQYTEEVTEKYETSKVGGGIEADEERDEFFEEAVRIVCRHQRGSASLLQRKLSIGYARAARILDQLAEVGVVGPHQGSKARDVLVKDADQFLSQEEKEEDLT